MTLTHRLFGLAMPALLAICTTACGDNGGESDAEDNADTGLGPDSSEPTGPSDNADPVEVEVPIVPRGFRMAVGVPADAVGTSFFDASLARAAESDMVVLTLESGVPWAALLAGEPTPADWDDWLTNLASATAGESRLVQVRWIDDDGAWVPEWNGGDAAPSGVGDPRFATAVTALTTQLTTVFSPDYMVPIAQINEVLLLDPSQIDPLVQTWRGARRAAQTVQPTARVFPTWDYATLLDAYERQDTAALALVQLLDEQLDIFALALEPARTRTGLLDLQAAGFGFADQLTSRRLALVATSWPATGFTEGDAIFASSENSQFNYLAWALQEADARGFEVVAWSPVVDPGSWLQEPCAGRSGCDAERVEETWTYRRSAGLVRADGRARRGLDLWLNYARRQPVR